MTENAKQLHNSNDEVMWRMRALKHTARSLAAKAKELERMAKADANIPAMDKASLEQVLRRIDNVMEWRFVDVLGEVQLDTDILTQSIDFETLRTLRQCVIQAIVDNKQAESEAEKEQYRRQIQEG